MNQTEFEEKLIEMLLRGDDPVLESLRNQYIHSTVISREFTGAGFFTEYEIKPGTPPAATGKKFQILDVEGEMEGDKDALGFILWVENGYFSTLEGHTTTVDIWPEDYSNVILYYNYPDGKRDYEELKAKWT